MSTRGQGHCLTLDTGSHSMKISNFSSETTGPFVTKYYVEPFAAEKTNICPNGWGHMTNIAAMPVESKSLSKLSSLESIDRWPCNLIFGITFLI